MRIWTSEHTFHHPWDTIVQAAWRKYPNPMNPSVVGMDVLDRYVDNQGILHSKRLMTTSWRVPTWVLKFIGMSTECHVHEYSQVDAKTKTMVLESRNLTLSNMIAIDEKLVYSQHPHDANRTVLRQEAIIKICGIPMTNYLEDLVKSTCSTNADKGRQAMEWVVDKIKEETHTLSKNAEEQFHNISKSTEEQLHSFSKAAEEQIKSTFSHTRQL